MNAFAKFFATIGKGFAKIFKTAQANGLTSDFEILAGQLVAQAQVTSMDPAVRREWVVAALQAAGLSENLSRMAVELAVLAFKEAHKGEPAAPVVEPTTPASL